MSRFVLEMYANPLPGESPVKTYDPILDKVIPEEDRASLVEDALGMALLNFRLNEAAQKILDRRAINDLISPLERVRRHDPLAYAYRDHLRSMSAEVKDVDPAGSAALHAIALCASARICNHHSRWCAHALDTIIDFVASFRRVRETGDDAGPWFARVVRKRIDLMIELYNTDFPLVDYHERTASS